jgi:hypothetical protein
LRQRTDFSKTWHKLDAICGHPNATVSYFIQLIIIIIIIIIISVLVEIKRDNRKVQNIKRTRLFKKYNIEKEDDLN